MNTSTQFPFRLHWTAQDLADAIPLRLSEMVVFTTTAGAHGQNDSQVDRLSRRELRGHYVPEGRALSLFGVHH